MKDPLTTFHTIYELCDTIMKRQDTMGAYYTAENYSKRKEQERKEKEGKTQS